MLSGTYTGLDDFRSSLSPAMNTQFLEDRVQVIPYCEFTERQNAAHPGIGFSLNPNDYAEMCFYRN